MSISSDVHIALADLTTLKIDSPLFGQSEMTWYELLHLLGDHRMCRVGGILYGVLLDKPSF